MAIWKGKHSARLAPELTQAAANDPPGPVLNVCICVGLLGTSPLAATIVWLEGNLGPVASPTGIALLCGITLPCGALMVGLLRRRVWAWFGAIMLASALGGVVLTLLASAHMAGAALVPSLSMLPLAGLFLAIAARLCRADIRHWVGLSGPRPLEPAAEKPSLKLAG